MVDTPAGEPTAALLVLETAEYLTILHLTVRSEAHFGRFQYEPTNTSFVVVRIEGSADVPAYQNEYPSSMDKKSIAALIVTRSIALSDGLDALLKAILQIDEVRIARNFENAFQQIKTSKARIILIDSALLGNDPTAVLEKVRMLSPESQRILLVEDVQEVNLMLHYTEAILVKGSAPSAIAALVTNLVVDKGEAL